MMANHIMSLHIWIINKHVFTITPTSSGNSTVNIRATHNAFSLNSQASLIHNHCASWFVQFYLRALSRLPLLWLLVFRFLIVVYIMYLNWFSTKLDSQANSAVAQNASKSLLSIPYTLNFTTINYWTKPRDNMQICTFAWMFALRILILKGRLNVRLHNESSTLNNFQQFSFENGVQTKGT